MGTFSFFDRVTEEMVAALTQPNREPNAGAGSDEIDADTLRRCQSGDPMALRLFVVRYERRVFALLSRMLGRGPHVEDLAQDVFLKAIRALPGFELQGTAKLSSWLLTLATRTAVDRMRKHSVRSEILGLETPDAITLETPEIEVQRKRLGRAIEQTAGTLSDEQRTAFVLHEFHGFSMRDIPHALSIPESTVKTRLHRARARLSKALQQHREDC